MSDAEAHEKVRTADSSTDGGETDREYLSEPHSKDDGQASDSMDEEFAIDLDGEISGPGQQGHTVRTALDDLHEGDDSHFEKSVRGKHPLPHGITNGMLYNDIIKIAWPALVELLLVQLTSMVDMMMVGNIGPLAISAVGYTNQPKFLLSTMFMSLNVGNTALVARARGAGDQERARLIHKQALMANFTLGLICSIIGFVWAEPLVRFVGASNPKVIADATTYLRIQMVGFLSIAITTTITSGQRAIGNSRFPMMYNTAANLINVVFNYLLIEGHYGFPRWEVAGASIATVMGQVAAMLMAFSVIFGKNAYLRVNFLKGVKPHVETLRNIFRIGIPSMLEQMMMRAGMIMYTRTVASLGDMLMATHQICMNIQSLTMMNGQAFATSATSLVGQSLGKKRGDMAAFYANRTQRVGMVVAMVLGGSVFAFAHVLISMYVNDPFVIANGTTVLRMVAIIQPLQVAQFVMAGVLRGAGDTRYTAMVTFVTVLVVRPAFAMYAIYVLKMGLPGAWFALILDQLLRTFLVLLRYNSGKWRDVARTFD